MTIIEYKNLIKHGGMPSKFVHLLRQDYDLVSRKIINGKVYHIIRIHSMPEIILAREGVDIRLREYDMESNTVGKYTLFHLKGRS